jgi:hypothetical protein
MILAAAWGVASLTRATTLLLAILRVRALWKRAVPLKFEEANASRGLVRFSERAGSRRAELCVSDEVDRPTVIGFFAPKILIPAWLVEKLAAEEMEQIVLHEAGHLSRADDWMNLLQKIALVFFPLNPALAWVERRLCFERELACDELVLRTTGAPRTYAACLASLAEHRLGHRGHSLALGALGRESELGRRVRRILCRGERMRPLQARLVLGGAMLGLLLAAMGFERCPQVVGFAPIANGSIAASVAVHAEDAVQSAYRYQPVIFHPQALHSQSAGMSRRQGKANADRERKPGLPTRSTAVTVSTAALRGGPVVASQAAFEDARPQNVEAGPEERNLAQWVVVTAWQGDDGSRMVLTTVQTASPHGAAATNVLQQQDQVHRYAAVPVRDGWLLIQL